MVSASFNPNDLAFGAGGFDWQNATPIIYSGKGAFDSFNPAIAHVGILQGGDANADGATNFSDLVKLAQNYNTSNDPTWSTGDFNGDGTVNFGDLVILAQHYNQVADVPPPPAGASAEFNRDFAAAFASVPEPGTAAMLMVVGAVTGCARRRRR